MKISNKIQLLASDSGFTLIELIVVLGILSMIMGIVIVDFSRQRNARDLNIAQNELVTNIRKVQSYSLFSRSVGAVTSAQYYLVKFSASASNQYFIQAITSATQSPALKDVETINLPMKVRLTALSLSGPIWSLPQNSACALLAFKSPFAKTYLNDGCAQTSPPFQSGDDYKKIVDFINNVPGATVSTDADLLITLSIPDSALTRKILIKGVTGLVCPTVDGTTCSF